MGIRLWDCWALEGHWGVESWERLGCLERSCYPWLGSASLVPCVEWGQVVWEDSGCPLGQQGWPWDVDLPVMGLLHQLGEGKCWVWPPLTGNCCPP